MMVFDHTTNVPMTVNFQTTMVKPCDNDNTQNKHNDEDTHIRHMNGCTHNTHDWLW